MPAGAVLPAIGLGVSAFGARSADRRGRRALSAQEQMHQEQMAMAREQQAFGQQHYDWARGMYEQDRMRFDPVLDRLTEESMANRTPDYGAITADTQAAFDSARQSDQRRMQAYGINPGDGAFGANSRRYGIGQATAEVNARQAARRGTENDQFGRLAALYGVGAQLQGQAMGGMGVGAGLMQGATGMGINAAGQAAGMHGNMAQNYGNLASSNMAGAVGHLGQLIDGFMSRPTGPTGSSFIGPGMPGMTLPGLPGQGPININRPGGG